MVIKNKAKDKKKTKGPKGKKARAKAKLDRQWGEVNLQENSTTGAPGSRGTKRIGKSRLLGTTTIRQERMSRTLEQQQHQQQQQQQQQQNHQSRTVTTTYTDSRQRQQRHGGHQDSDSTDDSDSMSTSTSHDEDNMDRNRVDPMNELLSMIQKSKKTKNIKKGIVVDDKMVSSSQQKYRVGDILEDDGEITTTNIENESHDGSDEEEGSIDDENNNDDDAAVDDDEIDDIPNDEDDASVLQNLDTPSSGEVDVFRQRFRREPFVQSQLQKSGGGGGSGSGTTDASSNPSHTTMKKIQITPTLELQINEPTCCPTSLSWSSSVTEIENNLINVQQKGNNEKNDWQSLSVATFSSNRVVLQRQWRKRHRKKKTKGSSKQDDDKNINNNNNANSITGMTDDQASIYTYLSRYYDTFITTDNNNNDTINNNNTKSSDISNDEYVKRMHQMYLLHILNHVLTSRTRIARNNRFLKDTTKTKPSSINNNNKSVDDDDDEDHDDKMIDPDTVRDQGFTRPTVLILLPTRGVCYRFVRDILQLVNAKLDTDQEERFEVDYGMIVDDNDNNDNNNNKKKKKDAEKERRRKAVLEKKGKEWNELFGDNANQDDDFKMGISFTPKAAATSSSKGMTKKPKANNDTNKQQQQQHHSNVSVKVYTDFFKSDIIVASPLGLKMLITPDEDDEEVGTKEGGGGGNFDYLSSIEICLLAHADVMMMQNWDHVNDVLALLNQPPRNNNNTDFSRVRNYLLEGQGSYWRQLILSSRFMDPYLLSTLKRFGKSFCGSIRARYKTRNEDAAITQVLLPIKQVFQKVPVASLSQQGTVRVEFFLQKVLPQILEHNQKHTLIYIPSYFDFCSLRNALLKRDDIPFVCVNEYSRTSEIGRGRARFVQGRKPLMLYTGRAHYFYRHSMKGILNLIFLGVPEHPNFYTDHVNLIGTISSSSSSNGHNDDDDIDDDMTTLQVSTGNKSCVVLFTKYEAHALERIVGHTNCNRMVNSLKETFLFYS
jgi:U3 small nucleolar RNA-associated protein 25